MGYFSILPDSLSFFETWAARFFLLLGAITIGPWALILLYDFLYYVWRTVTYEVPFVGGRARGRQRPSAPTLTKRPSGHRRQFSFGALENKNTGDQEQPESSHRQRLAHVKRRSEHDVILED